MGVLFIIIPIVLMLIGLLAWHAHVQALKRREELQALANEIGWSFAHWHDGQLTQRLRDFASLNQGHSHSAYNTLTGSIEMYGKEANVRTGDYTYKITRSNGKQTTTTTYKLSYLMVKLPFASTPPLQIRPEGFFDRIAGAMGFDDIDFESKEFSDRFHVSSRDERFAYDVIDPRMMEFLLDGDTPTIAIDRGVFVIIRKIRCWKPEEFRATIAWAHEFLERWPRHVVDRLASQPAY